MPELPLATQEAYGMPASVAPCIVDDLTLSINPADQSSRLSLLPSDSSCLVPVQLDHSSPTQQTPGEMTMSNLPSPPAELVSTLASYEGSGNSDDDYDDGCDVNDDDSDVEPDGDITLEPVSIMYDVWSLITVTEDVKSIDGSTQINRLQIGDVISNPWFPMWCI
jgi:hypothetical protein